MCTLPILFLSRFLFLSAAAAVTAAIAAAFLTITILTTTFILLTHVFASVSVFFVTYIKTMVE